MKKKKKKEPGDFHSEHSADEDSGTDCFSVLDNYLNLIIN